MDWLTFVHLFIYPMLGGAFFVLFVWTMAMDRTWHAVAVFWVFLAILWAAIVAHINYQGYLFG